MPQGVTVGSYNSYLDAQKAVDYLADQQFPVQYVSIVGNDLKLVERVTGRLSYPRVAMSGLLSGVWFGLFIGLLLSLFSPGGAFSVVTSVLMGAAFFALFGIVSYAMQRGKRDFTSTSQVLASSYDVIVAPEVAGEASRLLLQLPMRGNDGGARQHGQQDPQGGQHPGYGQGYGQPQEPQRPEGWGNPYGQRAEDAGQQSQTPEQQAPSTVSSDYRDLPDGRPQYGVRLNQAPSAAPAAPAHEPQHAEPQHGEPQQVEQQHDAGQPGEPQGEHRPQRDGQHTDGPVEDQPHQDPHGEQHGEPHAKDPRGE